MRKGELVALVVAALAVVGSTVAAFSYDAYLKAQAAAPEVNVEEPTVLGPKGNPFAGRDIYVSSCASCHGLKGEGGAGPDLRGVGTAKDLSVLYSWVLEPKAVTPRATMPRIPLSERAVADVVAYLVWLAYSPTTTTTATPTAMAEQHEEMGSAKEEVVKGETLYETKGCVACHGVSGVGTTLGPALPGHTPEQVKHQVRQPEDKMPAFSPEQLSDEDLNAIAEYIESLGPPSGEHEHE